MMVSPIVVICALSFILYFLATTANLTLDFGQTTVVIIAAPLSPIIVRLLDVRSDFLTEPGPGQHVVVWRKAIFKLLVFISYFFFPALNCVKSVPVVVVIW